MGGFLEDERRGNSCLKAGYEFMRISVNGPLEVCGHKFKGR